MYLLVFVQGTNETPVGLFEEPQHADELLKSIPGYEMTEEMDGDCKTRYEHFSPQALPDYMELEYKGNRLPLTRFMFGGDEPVEIIWKELPLLEQPGDGPVRGYTIVDAYAVDNERVADYIERRERGVARVKNYLERNGYEVERGCRGSEDGELLLYRPCGTKDWRMLTHLDPNFVYEIPIEDTELEQWLRERC